MAHNLSLHTEHCRLNSSQYSMHTTQWTMHSDSWYTKPSTLLREYCILNTVQVRLHNLHCTSLPADHCTLCTLKTLHFHRGYEWINRKTILIKICCMMDDHRIYISVPNLLSKLDGVGPVDNRPSTDKFHHFVPKKKKKKRDMWHVTCDMWHVTRDTWHVWGGEHSLKISAP